MNNLFLDTVTFLISTCNVFNKYVASRGALIMNDMLQRLAILWDDSFVLLVHSILEHAVQRILIVSLFI